VGRWVRVLLGPLPATVVLLPMLFAGGVGATIALVAGLVAPGSSAGARWAAVMATGPILVWVVAAGVGVLALWAVVLADSPAVLRQGPARWWLAAGLVLGGLAAGRWLWVLAMGGHSYGPVTWVVWLVMLLGPLVLGTYYLGVLLSR
jgi:hypothetical protein